jgi:hypothetical protein
MEYLLCLLSGQCKTLVTRAIPEYTLPRARYSFNVASTIRPWYNETRACSKRPGSTLSFRASRAESGRSRHAASGSIADTSTSGHMCAERGCYSAKSGLRRTTANCAGGSFVTRYDFSKKLLSSTLSAAGNSDCWFSNSLNLLRNSLEFESSPGRQIPMLTTHCSFNFRGLSDPSLPCQKARFYGLFLTTGWPPLPPISDLPVFISADPDPISCSDKGDSVTTAAKVDIQVRITTM